MSAIGMTATTMSGLARSSSRPSNGQTGSDLEDGCTAREFLLPPESSIRTFKSWLEAGVFRAAGVRESRAGMGITRRGVHVRLRATGRPPAVGVSFGLAHLHTATTCL